MAEFTNRATLSYRGGTTDSNTVTGELREVLGAEKTAVMNDYTPKDDVTFVISLVNHGETAFENLTVTDDLGAYLFGEDEVTLYPLVYTEGSLRYYINGGLQHTPEVEPGPPLVVRGVTVPANGNVILLYEASVTNFAPLGVEAFITNTATITGGGLAAPLVAAEAIGMESRADLSISKSMCPAVVTQNGQVTYTFVLENAGNIEASAVDHVVLTDLFDPKLRAISVTFDDVQWTEGEEYTYDEETGEFATADGALTVPAATYTQNEDGSWTITPGASVLKITGSV